MNRQQSLRALRADSGSVGLRRQQLPCKQRKYRLALEYLIQRSATRLCSRAADNIVELSDGRFFFGLGAGDFVSEHQAYGFDFQRHVGRFEDPLNIIKPLMQYNKFTYSGEFHQIDNAALLPKSSAGTPPILIGTLKGKPRMSRLVAQFQRTMPPGR